MGWENCGIPFCMVMRINPVADICILQIQNSLPPDENISITPVYYCIGGSRGKRLLPFYGRCESAYPKWIEITRLNNQKLQTIKRTS